MVGLIELCFVKQQKYNCFEKKCLLHTAFLSFCFRLKKVFVHCWLIITALIDHFDSDSDRSFFVAFVCVKCLGQSVQRSGNTIMAGCRHSGIILIATHVYLRKFDSVDHSTNYSLSRCFSGDLVNSYAQVK